MKHTLFRLLAVSFSIFLISLSSSTLFAQGPDGVGYRAHWPVLPAESAGNVWVWDFAFNANGTEPVALVVGSYLRNDRPGEQILWGSSESRRTGNSIRRDRVPE